MVDVHLRSSVCCTLLHPTLELVCEGTIAPDALMKLVS